MTPPVSERKYTGGMRDRNATEWIVHSKSYIISCEKEQYDVEGFTQYGLQRASHYPKSRFCPKVFHNGRRIKIKIIKLKRHYISIYFQVKLSLASNNLKGSYYFFEPSHISLLNR